MRLLHMLVVSAVVFAAAHYIPTKKNRVEESAYIAAAAFGTLYALSLLPKGSCSALENFFDAAAPDVTADEANLVFGDITAAVASRASKKVYYSGDTLSMSTDTSLFLGKSSAATPTLKLNPTNDGQLSKFRIVVLNQVDFSMLRPVSYGQTVTLMHNNQGEDRYVASKDGSLTFDNKVDAKDSNISYVFKLFSALDPSEVGVVSWDNGVLIKYAGNDAGADSWVVAADDGTLKTTGKQAKAVKFNLVGCSTDCCAVNWRFS